ncbi:MAG: septum formation initiator family protein [Clostridia bacterium]|nr:septum formation initiator family protein [Clostridia bacterium]
MKKKIRINRFIIIAVVIYFIYTVICQQQTLNSYEKEATVYENQIVQAKEETEQLKDIKNNINSTEYIENVAREKIGMYLPNERVYIDITN